MVKLWRKAKECLMLIWCSITSALGTRKGNTALKAQGIVEGAWVSFYYFHIYKYVYMCIYLYVCLICICGLTGINWVILACSHSCRCREMLAGAAHSRWLSRVVSSWYWLLFGSPAGTAYQDVHMWLLVRFALLLVWRLVLPSSVLYISGYCQALMN